MSSSYPACAHGRYVVRTISPQSVQTTCATPVHFKPYQVTFCELCNKRIDGPLTPGSDGSLTWRNE